MILIGLFSTLVTIYEYMNESPIHFMTSKSNHSELNQLLLDLYFFLFNNHTALRRRKGFHITVSKKAFIGLNQYIIQTLFLFKQLF